MDNVIWETYEELLDAGYSHVSERQLETYRGLSIEIVDKSGPYARGEWYGVIVRNDHKWGTPEYIEVDEIEKALRGKVFAYSDVEFLFRRGVPLPYARGVCVRVFKPGQLEKAVKKARRAIDRAYKNGGCHAD